jgi:two-component system cell cycle sensor histidine kinase PleC
MVLVVDDHPDTCTLLTRVLRRAGFEAEFVTSGIDAIAFLSRRLPQVVVLDVMMPDMDGIDTLRAMRDEERSRDVPVIMYSADASHDRMGEAMRQGAQGYLVKGTVGWDELLAAVRRFA